VCACLGRANSPCEFDGFYTLSHCWAIQDFDTSFVLSIVAVTLEHCNQCGPNGPSPLFRVPAAGVATSPPRRDRFPTSLRSKHCIDGSSWMEASRLPVDIADGKICRSKNEPSWWVPAAAWWAPCFVAVVIHSLTFKSRVRFNVLIIRSHSSIPFHAVTSTVPDSQSSIVVFVSYYGCCLCILFPPLWWTRGAGRNDLVVVNLCRVNRYHTNSSTAPRDRRPFAAVLSSSSYLITDIPCLRIIVVARASLLVRSLTVPDRYTNKRDGDGDGERRRYDEDAGRRIL
jgi:hypothetical protein